TNHHELIVRPNVSELFETVVSQFDEPFGDSSAIPTYLVSELARQHVTIALSGTGADELFAGYERYWSIPLSAPFQALPHGIVRGLSKGLQRLPSGHGKRSVINRAQRFLQSQGTDLVERHTALISLFDGAIRKEGYTADFAEAVASHSAIDTLRLSLDDRIGLHDLDRMLGLDTQTVLPDDYLTKDDRMSMATSLEVRVPFLDHTLVEFAAACPPRLKQKHLQTKVLLRQLAQDQIPRSILDRPKHGFEVPVAEWIGNDLAGTVTDLLLSDSTQLGAYLRPEFVSNLVELHTSEARNLSREIWSLMSLEMWLRSGKAGV
ncbi:MAG: asparagine synthetase B, partial [Gemmatimonadetes bacterium]|nr:asparagine synthetase B [Gemmatimonadota bacterium]